MIVVFCNKNSFPEIYKTVLKKNKKGKNIQFYLFNDDDGLIVDERLSADLISINMKDMASEYMGNDVEIGIASVSDFLNDILGSPELMGDLLVFIKTVQTSRLEGGKTLSDLFYRNEFPYWKIIEGPFFLYDLLPLFIVVKLCKKLLLENIDSVFIQDNAQLPYMLIYNYVVSRKMDVRIISKVRKAETLQFFRPVASSLYNALKTVSLLKKRQFTPSLSEFLSSQPVVLFLCFFSKQIYSLLPVLKSIQSEKQLNCIVLLGRGAKGQNELDELGIQYFVLEECSKGYLNSFDLWKSIGTWFAVRKNLTNKRFQSEYEKVDISYFIHTKLLKYFSPFGVLLGYFTRSFLDKIKPALLVQVDDVNIYNRTFLQTGKTKNIPTLHIQYGVIDHFGHDWLTNFAQKIAVWGEYDRDILVKAGIENSRIELTGQPRYDSLVHCTIGEKKDNVALSIKKRWNLLFTSVPYSKSNFNVGFGYLNYDEYIIQMKTLYLQIAMMENVHLTVKPHPNQNDREENHKQILSQIVPYPHNITIASSKSDILHLLDKCDALITTYSTTGYEAMILKKPIFILNVIGRQGFIDYTRYGASIGLYREDEISSKIYEVLSNNSRLDEIDKGQEKFLRYYYSGMDAKATERVVCLIHAMINEGNKADN